MRINAKNAGLTFILAAALLIVVDAFLVWPYAYRTGYGHGDVQAMEFALFFWSKNHGPLPHFAYGRDFSFGWYYLMLYLSKLFKFPLQPETFPWVANFSASIASTITSICLLGILVRFFPLAVALTAVILWRFIPEVWELSTYAHPWTIAMPFLTAGAWVYTAQLGHDGTLNKSWKFYLSCIASTLLMTASLTIRADMVFFMPLLIVLVYFHNRKAVLPLVIIMTSSCILFLLLRHLAVGGTRPSVIDYVARFARLERIPINLMLALYPISGYLLMITATYLLKPKNKAKIPPVYLVAGLLALAPTLLFWLPIGPCLRHFTPLYITVAVLCAYLLVKGLNLTTFPSTSFAVVSLLLSNMLVTELAFQTLSPMFPPRTVQIGVQRRVMESVALGIPWLNHIAIQRLNELQEQYCVSALSRLDTRPVILVQMEPYRLCVLAMERFGTVKRFKSDNGLTVWQLGTSENAPWCVDIPESADREWLKNLQSFAERHKRELRFLGPRIPKALIVALEEQTLNEVQSAKK